MGCQKKIARQIVQGGGDYVLAVKGNQEKLHAAIVEQLHEDDFENSVCRRRQTQEKGHGRIEQRDYYQAPLPEKLRPFLKNREKLTTIGQVVTFTERDGKERSEVRYYISSLKPGVKRFSQAVRGHWGIENSLHWVLDVTFNEDQSRIRKDHGPKKLCPTQTLCRDIHQAGHLARKHQEKTKTSRLKQSSTRKHR